MKPSPEARRELGRAVRDGRIVEGWPERRNRFWSRLWPWVAIALVLGWAAADKWLSLKESHQARVERDQAYILSQDRCAGIMGLPPVSFVLTGDPAALYDQLRSVERESASFRVLLLKDELDARAAPRLVTYLPPRESR